MGMYFQMPNKGCIGLLGPPRQGTTDWVVSTADIYFLTVLQARSQDQGMVRLGSSGAPLSGSKMAFSVSSHGVPSVYMCA